MSEPKPTDYYQGQSVSDFIVLHAMPWHLANVVKYLTRWWAKDDMTALYKARDYLDTFIKRCETQPATKAFIVAGIKATIEARRAAKVKPTVPHQDEFGTVEPGDEITESGGKAYRVKRVVVNHSGQTIYIDFAGDSWPPERTESIGRAGWYARGFRRVPDAKPADAAPAEPESDFDSLEPGDWVQGGMLNAKYRIECVYPEYVQFETGESLQKYQWHKYGYRKVAKS
jgi:hypothetical protein